MNSKICVLCGSEFIPASSRQKYCNKELVRTCEVCGAEYISRCNVSYSKCCSKECTDKLAYDNRTANLAETTCKWCGRLFKPKSSKQLYCTGAHVATCEVCGAQYSIDLSKQDKRRTCSAECATKLKFKDGNPFASPESRNKAKQTCLERYGVEYPAQSESIQRKMQNTSLERYGVSHFVNSPEYVVKSVATNLEKYGTKWAIQSESIKEKRKNSVQQKYGVDSVMKVPEIVDRIRNAYLKSTGYLTPLNNPEVQLKIRDTIKEKYGVEHISQSEEIQQRIRESMLEKYGVEYPLQSEEIQSKIKATNLERYGVENPTQSIHIRAKTAETCMKKYGVEHYSQTMSHRSRMMLDPSKADEWALFCEDPQKYVNLHFDSKPSYKELEAVLGVSDTTIQARLQSLGLLDIVRYTISYAEDEIVDFIKGVQPQLSIERHNRIILNRKEIDIVIPEYHLGIEVNPTATHNSSIGHMNDLPKAPSYHQLKTDEAESAGYFLFHIFGYEWSHKKDIIKSMLGNLLHANASKIYARNCEIREVDGKTALRFLEINHRQGNTFAKIRLGLYCDDELVSLMTFNKMRNTAGTGNENLSECMELSRFCNKLNTSVIGGASKLFAYFVKTYDPESIRSFSDRAHTRGTLYTSLGFREVRRSSPSYVWVDLKTNSAVNRLNTQKKNIKKFLKDDDIDLSMTEKQIMEEHGYVQVFDSGTITWEWTK